MYTVSICIENVYQWCFLFKYNNICVTNKTQLVSGWWAFCLVYVWLNTRLVHSATSVYLFIHVISGIYYLDIPRTELNVYTTLFRTLPVLNQLFWRPFELIAGCFFTDSLIAYNVLLLLSKLLVISKACYINTRYMSAVCNVDKGRKRVHIYDCFHGKNAVFSW